VPDPGGYAFQVVRSRSDGQVRVIEELTLISFGPVFDAPWPVVVP